MNFQATAPRQALALKAGDWIEVRSQDEILQTLDDRGRLDGLPFMPEMLQFCGKRFKVFKSAHKTCDTVQSYRSRGMPNAVHLEGLRCDGSGHGGCEARCLLFWKEDWLKRAPGPGSSAAVQPIQPAGAANGSEAALENLRRCALAEGGDTAADEVSYTCQATALRDATTALSWRDPRHYLRDLTSRNISLPVFLRYVTQAAIGVLIRRVRRNDYPYHRPGTGPAATAAQPLNLQPGELVRVRTRDEIYRTLKNRRERGLWFDVEMEPFCGRVYRVLARVNRIIDEKNGKMLRIPRDCIILDNVTCGGCLSRNRLFCPRHIYPYWRESWLERVSSNENSVVAPANADSASAVRAA